jgi:beta-aspartyl-peptidase (threonine type)
MPDRSPVILVHGGAGPAGAPDPAVTDRLTGVRAAAAAGWEILARGGSALDAVEAAVRLLEDDPDYNAGTGACLTSAGDVELDASIMDGATLRCGAVAAVKDVVNPVTLARAVMERSEHALLVAAGASAFAREVGIPACDNARLITPRQRQRWERHVAERAAPPRSNGTVGAVARDRAGHLAAATSTGGMAMKRPGRVGDTPLVGCGTYADDAAAAVSCTGHGERIIQVTLARACADLVAQGRSAPDAAAEAIRQLGARVGGEGGVIVVGPAGEVGFAHNAEVMSRAWSRPDGTITAEL